MRDPKKILSALGPRMDHSFLTSTPKYTLQLEPLLEHDGMKDELPFPVRRRVSGEQDHLDVGKEMTKHHEEEESMGSIVAQNIMDHDEIMRDPAENSRIYWNFCSYAILFGANHATGLGTYRPILL